MGVKLHTLNWSLWPLGFISSALKGHSRTLIGLARAQGGLHRARVGLPPDNRGQDQKAVGFLESNRGLPCGKHVYAILELM